MKIGIITICTGRYAIFFDDLYRSFERFFLRECEKTYFVLTDSDPLPHGNVRRIDQPKLGWPHDTMMRFHMFNRIEEQLLEHDFLYFVNANMKTVREVGGEVIPDAHHDYLVGAQHPGYFDARSRDMPFDRNPRCSCYVRPGEGRMYYQGCFNGGSSEAFLEMSRVLAANLDRDEANGIVPLWHDESQLNWYFKDRRPLTLLPGYVYPESWKLPFAKFIVQRDKQKYGGHDYLRA